ncbi:MAG: hypothetical protein C0403_01165, partial [Desulfobacterium sp.]|nr:hypothetical protein [Desulfobacterium sp.]
MKKTIILTVSLVSLLFLIGGAYITTTIKNATSELDLLIKLHQVEILREHLLLNLKKVQTDLLLINTPHIMDKKNVTDNVRNLNQMVISCSDCHHTPEVQARLSVLNADVEKFILSFARSFEKKNNMAQFVEERGNAYHLSEDIIEEVSSIVHMASSKLNEKTDSSLKDISHTKSMLYIVVLTTPFIAACFGFFFLRTLTKPLKLLVEATRKIKDGHLDFKIMGLKDEFAELADAFNEMSTSLKHYLHNITEEEKRYRLLFESAADAIFIIEAEGENFGKIIEANPSAARMHGYTMDELLRLNLIKDLDVPDAIRKAPERAAMMLQGNWITAEIEHRRKDGSVFPVEISAGLLNFMGHKYFLAFDRDISERKEMENQIIQAKQDWEDTFDEITDMITIHDNNYGIIRANKAAKHLLDLPLQTTTTKKCFHLYHGKAHPPEECLSCNCFSTREPTTFETYEPHLGKYLEVRAMPRFDKDNKMIGLIHVVRDITQRKKREEAFQRAEQLKIVGEWAAGLAHEIKNPLAGVKASVEMLRYEKNISSENELIVMKSIDEIKRIEKLLKSLLNFAKPPKLQLSHVNINQVLERA